MGGSSQLGTSSKMTAYTPSTNSWVQVRSLPTARYGLAAANGPDGRIYALGGYTSGNQITAEVDAYTPATNRWRKVAPMPTPRAFLAAATGADGRIYAIGGNGANGEDLFLDTVEAYTPSTNTWVEVSVMPTARQALAAATGPDGRIYAIGGSNSPTGLRALGITEAYTPTTNTWSELAVMPTPRYGLGAATGTDGRIYAIGGYNPQSSEPYIAPRRTHQARRCRWHASSALKARFGKAAMSGPNLAIRSMRPS